MNYPTDLKYSKTHEWVKEEDGMTVVGISDFAQDSLGDIVFIGLPSVGDTVTMGEALGRRGICQGSFRHRLPGDRRCCRSQRRSG